MKIGFDFDGTLAVWPRGARVDYNDAHWAMTHAAAVLGAVKWLKCVLARGHEVVVITGRGSAHRNPLRYWLRQFIGQRIDVITRPDHVSLDPVSQAAWKDEAMHKLGVVVYVGDNHSIDNAAARSLLRMSVIEERADTIKTLRVRGSVAMRT